MSETLQNLYQTILSRKGEDADKSYTASLFQKGTAKIVQKVGEEAVETCIEAMQGDRDKLKNESADLLFHMLGLWADQDIKPEDVFAILDARTGTSGHAEKAARKS